MHGANMKIIQRHLYHLPVSIFTRAAESFNNMKENLLEIC